MEGKFYNLIFRVFIQISEFIKRNGWNTNIILHTFTFFLSFLKSRRPPDPLWIFCTPGLGTTLWLWGEWGKTCRERRILAESWKRAFNIFDKCFQNSKTGNAPWCHFWKKVVWSLLLASPSLDRFACCILLLTQHQAASIFMTLRSQVLSQELVWTHIRLDQLVQKKRWLQSFYLQSTYSSFTVLFLDNLNQTIIS